MKPVAPTLMLEEMEKLAVAGEDVHLVTAKQMFPDASVITPEMRKMAKISNFCFIYGGGRNV